MPGNAPSCLAYGARTRPSLIPPRRRHAAPNLKPLYGWAAEQLTRLCRIEPGLVGFALDAPSHTRHFIALCLAGMERHGRVTEVWLAGALASRSRREVLREVWAMDPGSTRALMRLDPELLDKATYEALMRVLSDPARRRAYGDVLRPTERAILRLAEAPDDLVAAYRGRLVPTFGAAGILFLVDGIKRLRPDLSPSAIRRSLNTLEKPARIEHLFSRLTRNLPLPDPPWAGTETIRPLRSIPELRVAGIRLENCLGTFAIWSEALSGQRAFYLVEDRELAVVALARHEVFGTWFVHSLAKRRSGEPAWEVKARIISSFAAAGFPYFDGAPIGTSLDGND
jgi:hypothetical protein